MNRAILNQLVLAFEGRVTISIRKNKRRKPRYEKLLSACILMVLWACSSAGSDNTTPLVGHWTFTQLTVNHPDSAMYAGAPSLCIGDVDSHADGTWAGWNVCLEGNATDRSAVAFSGTWVRISAYHYRVNNGDYDFILSKDGVTGAVRFDNDDKQEPRWSL